MTEAKKRWARAMRKDWDDRARADAFYYSTWKVGHRWSLDEFFDSGERDYLLWVEPVVKSVGIDPARSEALELGCGAGRMTRSLARRFRRVHAVDVSPQMLSQARAHNPHLDNVAWDLVDGFDLPMFRDGQLDFAFSFLVFQHVPHREIILGNVAEMLRVLRPEGLFLFQYNGETAPIPSLKARLIWGILDRWRVPLLPRLFGIDTKEAGKTWDGARLKQQEVVDLIEAHGGSVAGSKGAGTPAAWCWGLRR